MDQARLRWDISLIQQEKIVLTRNLNGGHFLFYQSEEGILLPLGQQPLVARIYIFQAQILLEADKVYM